jgi:lysyl-tRNA synthetase class 2
VIKNWPEAWRKNTLLQRASIIQEIRHFFIDQGYLEVETPYRIPSPLPEAHIDAIPSGTWFLHPSPEICMKRMLASGYEKIFQICRCWRDRERGRQHIPEFTLLEWYRTNCHYRSMMEECERLIQFIAMALNLEQKIIYRGQEISLTTPWERISVREAFHRYTQSPVTEALEHDLFDEIMVNEIEPHLGIRKPTFLYDYPAERGSLARLKEGDPSVAERFELYMGGLEIANGFSELIDVEEQRKRFEKENEIRRAVGKSVYAMPERFLEELKNMPPSAGIALGVDRLVMVLMDAPSIDEVIAFTPEDL